ncbi:single-stranded DNA-binding protein [Streptomyces iconiensis]|uniref:Single-stranded DNA-binding protein n=1 Tax=Streptomyces iconiensis TaxID=1384038 RepID=A0ABT7A6B9_9ACTN|nr:single-stranded DNA-binding protein [Streptomyces iconiensis]MDJ1136617.1 single-stranded DNA-binding protein [Streptomyces iconiensis]
MNETHTTVAGNVATPVDYRTSSSGVPVARFRLASTVRRFDRQRGNWTDAFTSFYTVWAWRSLATNVASSVSRGEPVIVRGQLRILEEEREGRRLLAADLTASSVGHDLSRGTAVFMRAARAGGEPVVAGSWTHATGAADGTDPWAVSAEPVAATVGRGREAATGTALGTAAGTVTGEEGASAEGDIPGQRPVP